MIVMSSSPIGPEKWAALPGEFRALLRGAIDHDEARRTARPAHPKYRVDRRQRERSFFAAYKFMTARTPATTAASRFSRAGINT